MSKKVEHVPVLLKEVLSELKPKKGKKFIDATVGFGGHTKHLVKHQTEVLGIDWDPEVLERAKERLSSCCPDASWHLAEANFRRLKKVSQKKGFFPVDGVLFDLGISRWHFKKAGRGFSFDDQNLDMRINPETDQTAKDIINNYSFEELDELFTKLVQEKLAKPIAKAVVNTRRRKPITSGRQLADLIEKVYQEKKAKTKSHPATKIFLGLRIKVNQELENLEEGLKQAIEVLKIQGKVLVITFHSGEDRLVKLFGRELKNKGQVETKLVFPTREEIKKNRLARSAKLRVIKKLK